MTPLDERFRLQAEQCRQHRSELTATLLEGAATDLHGGAVGDLLQPLAGDPNGSVPALRFAGALHRLVLERRAPVLALHYPSVGGTAPVTQVWGPAREAVAEHQDTLRDLVRRPVQTNEVGRAAVLLGGLQHVVAATGLPVRLLEVGASAGLNLRVDAFAYEVGDRVLGDPDSPVRLVQPWQGPLPPDVPVRVADRLGCDPAPLDPNSTEDRLTLTSYVWADQAERFERLRSALRVAAGHPAVVEPIPASAFLARELAEPAPGVVTVVWHSIVRQYMSPTERRDVDAVLTWAGGRAEAGAPLAHLALEPAHVGQGWRFVLTLRLWPGDGTPRVLAHAHGHGPPVVWA